MIYGSVCSGIEAATVAWHPLGWKPAFFSEIEAFPRAVLKHHYPEVPLHGDFTTIKPGEYEPIDLLVGGTPCQSFSVAGLRGGLDDDRGNLALEYLRLADRLRPRWLVWENVPGVLSSNGGRDFGSILGGMGELGYGVAYRVLDAQFFGVAQRRRRVFVVGYLGDWRRAAAVLFERHSLSGHPAPRRATRAGTAYSLGFGPVSGSGDSGRAPIRRTPAAFGGGANCNPTDVSTALAAHPGGRFDIDQETFLIAHSLRGEGFDASEDGTGRGTPIVPVPFDTTQITSAANRCAPKAGDPCHPLAAGAHAPCIAFSSKDHGADALDDLSPTLRAGGHDGSHANAGVPPAIAFALRGREGGAMPEVGGDQVGALRSASGGSSRDYVAFNITPSNSNKDYNAREAAYAQAVTGQGGRPSARGGDLIIGSAVRRLTPVECERLQGFPDGYTNIPWRGKDTAPDGPRYKALGNSMAVPCMAWIGRRIAAVEALQSEQVAAA